MEAMKTPNETQRGLAMKWWNKQPKQIKIALTIYFYGDRFHTSLTGREIEKMYKLIGNKS